MTRRAPSNRWRQYLSPRLETMTDPLRLLILEEMLRSVDQFEVRIL